MKKYIISVDGRIDRPKYIGQAFHTLNGMPELSKDQFEAFKSVFERELVIIQGPPATGKTFLALKIVQKLLTNYKVKILIVFQTNFALDQFIAGVEMFYPEVVRFNGKGTMKKARKSRVIGMAVSAAMKFRNFISDISPEVTSKLDIFQ